MEEYGYLQQIRRQRRDGTFQWEHYVTDTLEAPESTIAGKSSDGETSAGKPGDITTSPHQENINTPSPYPSPRKVLLSSACMDEAQERFKGYSVSALEIEWREVMTSKGETPKNPDKAFLGWAAIYTKNHPLTYGGGF